MIKKPQKGLPPKQLKIAVASLIAVLFVLGLILIAQGFIDTKNYSEQIVAAIQKQTNRKVSIKGTATIALLPTPTLFIPGLELRDPANDKPAPAVTINMTSIKVSLFSVFSDKLRISSITMDHPILELVQAEDNHLYLDWMNTTLLKALSDNSNSGAAIKIVVNDGKILYRDNQTEKNISIDGIYSTVFSGNNLDASGIFSLAGHDLNFTLSAAGVADKDVKKTAPFLLKLTSGPKDFLELKGDMDMSGDLPDLKGKFALKVENAPSWMKAIRPQEKQLLLQQVANQLRKNDAGDGKVALPLEISSEWSSNGLSIEMKDMTLQGLGSGGAGTVDLSWKEWKPDVNVDMKFSAFNYDQWSQLLVAGFGKSDAELIVYHQVNEVPENPIPNNISILLTLKADEIYYGQQVWKEAQMSTTIGSGAVTVNQFNVKLQGESRLAVFGVISPSPTGDLRFEGSMETNGKSLRQTLTVFDPTAVDLPETGFGDFFAHSNMFISSEQLRLSEADVKLGDLHLNGGLVAYFDANPRVEADIKLKNISFDYFRDVWRERQKTSDQQEDFFLKFDKSMSFSWLKKLSTAIDFKIYVEHFTFLDRNGDNASFRLYAKNGDLGVYDINFIYPSDITKGYFKLNVNGEQPALLLNMTTSQLNTDYFNAAPYRSTPVNLPLSHSNSSTTAAPSDATEPAASTNDVTDKKTDASSPADVTAATAPATAESAATSPAVAASDSTDKATASSVADVTKEKTDAATAPATAEVPVENATDTKKLEIKPQANTILLAENSEAIVPPRPLGGIDDMVKKKDKLDPHFAGENKKNWSEKLLDMSWLNGFSGELELNVGRLTHKDVTVGNLKLKSSFGKDLVMFKTLSFSYWGGQCSILGSLYGGKVPGFSISFTLVDAQVQQLLGSLTQRQNISGQVSVSASVTSSGVNILSWVSQAEGKMVVIGRNIYVQGISMQGVVDSVAISRTSSDVLNSVNRSIFNGFTIFSVDGNLNIKNGAIRTPGIGLRTASSIGNLTGELRLVPWTLELSALFQFPAMSNETVPTLTVQYSGTPDSGELKTDTSSLESFVAKRIISQ